MEHKGTPTLETQRLLLRPFTPADLDSCLRNWAADPAVYRYMSQEPQTPEEVAAWLSGADEAYTSPDTYYWAVVEKASGEVIGEIFVDDYGARNRWCELDWKIGKAFWGQGYTTEAVNVLLPYLLDEVGFHRVQAKCCVENQASERVMQKSSMTKDGILRGYFRGKDGQFKDVVMYAKLAEDGTTDAAVSPG